MKPKEPGKIGIVSYPWHLERFFTIIECLKIKNDISGKMEFYGIETNQKLIETLYEILARKFTEERLRKGIEHVEETGDVTEGTLKTLINYVMKIFS